MYRTFTYNYKVAVYNNAFKSLMSNLVWVLKTLMEQIEL